MNEAEACSAAKACCEAQDIYRRTDWNGDGVLEFAQAAFGDFSLYEKKADAADLLLIDYRLVTAFGYPKPYHLAPPYQARILTGQGPNAAGGARSYLVEGKMTQGYAFVLWPVYYGPEMRLTYIVDQTHTVYAKDLGENTAKVVEGMRVFDPDPSWKPVASP